MEVLKNITRRKLRSFLTILGIVIGIFALNTMGSMAEHFNALLDGGVRYFSGNVQVGGLSDVGSTLVPASKAQEIKVRIEGVAAASPNISLPAKPGGSNGVSFGIPDLIFSYDPSTEPYSSFKLSIAKGRSINTNSRGEVALGSQIAKEFNADVGSTVALPVKPKDAKPDFVNHQFTVIGIYQPTLTAPDTSAYISLADAQTLLKDTLPDPIKKAVDIKELATGITVYGNQRTDLDVVADDINAKITGVKATRPTDTVNNFKAGAAIFTGITTGAALLALIIGGLSVINTMIMSVSERTREIGLKRAVGARRKHIMLEFLSEAVLIGLLGGLIGLGISVATIWIVNAITPASQSQLFLITPRLLIGSLGFAVGLGALAGVIPAIRASRLDPVKALRYE
jgi:putative ABC transport system permease protein